MFVESTISTATNSASFTSSYRDNAYKILDNIEKQFVRAVEAVNATALQNGAHGIFFIQNGVHNKGPIREGDEFKKFTTFSSYIAKGPEIDNNYALRTTENCILFLETVTPFSGKVEDLKQMALDGNIPEFEEVYTYWLEELNNEIAFFEANQLQILSTKEKINRQFISAVKDAQEYTRENGFVPIKIGLFAKDDPEGEIFEPLDQHRVIKVIDDGRIRMRIGIIKLVETREQFKQIVLRNESYDFTKIFARSSKELKEIIDSANTSKESSYLSFRCTLL